MSRLAELERSFEGCFDAWCALATAPGREREVADAIEALGFSTLVLQRRSYRFRKLGAPRAELPRYVLARVAMTGPRDWQAVMSIEGVTGVLWDAHRVATIPDRQVEQMKRGHDQVALLELTWWLAAEGRIRPTAKHQPAPKKRSQRRKLRRERALAKLEAA